MRKNTEGGRLNSQERIIAAEEWEALSLLLDECRRRDIDIEFSIKKQNFSLKINSWLVPGKEGVDFRTIRELVASGWEVLHFIETTDAALVGR